MWCGVRVICRGNGGGGDNTPKTFNYSYNKECVEMKCSLKGSMLEYPKSYKVVCYKGCGGVSFFKVDVKDKRQAPSLA
jgi:hypothetical protein